MYYDSEKLAELDGAAKASTFWLSQVLKPVLARQEKEQGEFDVISSTVEEARRHQELRALLTAMQSYCEATELLVQQLSTNLTETEKTAQRESSRSAMFLHQIRLVYADLKTEQALSLKQLETFQILLPNGI